jgi:hypothetical protein
VLVINLNYEEINQGRAEAESERLPAPLHHVDYDDHLQAEELRLAITERQANVLSEEENRARVEAEAERKAN